MNKDVSKTHDSNDPWTYFGSFSKEQIDGAVTILKQAGITFTILEDKNFGSGWSGPHSLWIDDNDSLKAQELLVPYFKTNDKQS